ncbi:uncharacterized protein LOC128957202 isoform X2 [Oppia nitens]|uniref:uncharacterized protein LOC128957202 isoform X2 n=1 Tax=Oppia nitens TaxID=1686743 RepID=UPI0023DC13C6|nr:uncharacterized protein LOC128957202 isoform X2 [Oppia nitens]
MQTTITKTTTIITKRLLFGKQFIWQSLATNNTCSAKRLLQTQQHAVIDNNSNADTISIDGQQNTGQVYQQLSQSLPNNIDSTVAGNKTTDTNSDGQQNRQHLRQIYQQLSQSLPNSIDKTIADNSNKTTDTNSDGQQNRQHLRQIYQQLSESLPNFFVSTHCYHLYSPNLIFEDNLRNIKTLGLTNYIKQLSMVKLLAHLKYSHKRLDVLKITEHPEDQTVRVRWRVVGTPGLGIIFMFWRYSFNVKKSTAKDRSEWTDGFSIFHVGSDGKIDKHIIEKIMPDDNPFILGLVPQSATAAAAAATATSNSVISYQQLVAELMTTTLTTNWLTIG